MPPSVLASTTLIDSLQAAIVADDDPLATLSIATLTHHDVRSGVAIAVPAPVAKRPNTQLHWSSAAPSAPLPAPLSQHLRSTAPYRPPLARPGPCRPPRATGPPGQARRRAARAENLLLRQNRLSATLSQNRDFATSDCAHNRGASFTAMPPPLCPAPKDLDGGLHRRRRRPYRPGPR